MPLSSAAEEPSAPAGDPVVAGTTATSRPTSTATPETNVDEAVHPERSADAAASARSRRAPTPASAAGDESEVPEVPEIVVTGRRRRGQVSRDPTASATVIDADRFQGEAKNVADLVATAPGVAVNDYGGLGHLSTVSIRGATADGVLVLLDGVPLNTAFGGGVDLSTIPRAWIERIEVVRGVEGAMYGAGALGGVVNVVTRRATGPGGSAELGAGSFDTFTAAADRALTAGRASIRVAAAADAAGGAFPYQWDQTADFQGDNASSFASDTRRNNSAGRASGLVSLRAPAGAATLDLVAHVTAARRELPGVPRNLTLEDRQDDGRALLSVAVSAPGPRESLAFSGRATGRLDLLDTRAAGVTWRQRGGAAGLDGEARWSHGPGLLRIGVEGREEVLDSAGLGERRTRTDLAVSASEDVVAGRVRLSPAVRAERVGPFDGVSAKVGASVRLAGPLALRASAGRSFRAPSFAELFLRQGLVTPNPALAPEEGIGGDAALVVDAGPVYASAGGHATVYRDLITYTPVGFGQLKPLNTGRSLVRGLELEAALAPIRPLLGLALSASYTLLATEILRGDPGTLGNWVPHRARQRLFARASLAPGRAGLHVEAHYVGHQYMDPGNTGRIPPALVWNAGASYLLARRHAVRLHVDVRNLLDDRAFQDALGNPLPGRTVFVTLRAGSTENEGAP